MNDNGLSTVFESYRANGRVINLKAMCNGNPLTDEKIPPSSKIQTWNV